MMYDPKHRIKNSAIQVNAIKLMDPDIDRAVVVTTTIEKRTVNKPIVLRANNLLELIFIKYSLGVFECLISEALE